MYHLFGFYFQMIWTILSCCLLLGKTATFLAQNEKGIATPFTTDDQGYFRVPLEPGHYIFSLNDKKGGIGHYGPFEVDVVADRMTKVEWRCDTGIR